MFALVEDSGRVSTSWREVCWGPRVGYEGGIIRNIDVGTITAIGVCDLLPDAYRIAPTSCHYRDPTFQTFDLTLNNFESDLDARYLMSILQDQIELHLYYEHGQIDDSLELNEEDIRKLERVEDERREQEAELKRKYEDIERMEQEVAEKRKQEEIERKQEAAEKKRREEEMERMGPKVKDWDEKMMI
ncbi:hypothetical protein CRG98_037583 [Punica granatum]|uniref:Uncharacterized protein n=1 Tax=Punica granatum TaxID=22663 RepID=A0A2I0IDG2_PUNGR|nr:hypothetical protein CRG98_037583 [Punica granatum]